jgi:2'-5' RNA ligase
VAGSEGAAPTRVAPGTAMPTMGMPITPGPAADALTIGVAVEIPDPWADELQAWREDFGDPLARAIPAHVTLLPPTAVPRPMLKSVVDHLEKVSTTLDDFELLLEGTDTFRPVSPVVFVRVAAGGQSCDVLQRAVRTGPLARDLTFPFHPHVTVAHHVDDGALDRAMITLAGFTAAFTVSAFVLYEHGADGVWRPRHRFAFGGGEA